VRSPSTVAHAVDTISGSNLSIACATVDAARKGNHADERSLTGPDAWTGVCRRRAE